MQSVSGALSGARQRTQNFIFRFLNEKLSLNAANRCVVGCCSPRWKKSSHGAHVFFFAVVVVDANTIIFYLISPLLQVKVIFVFPTVFNEFSCLFLGRLLQHWIDDDNMEFQACFVCSFMNDGPWHYLDLKEVESALLAQQKILVAARETLTDHKT